MSEARSLVKKLAEVMGEVERVAKSGRNEFHRYDYATEADIVAAVRGGMSKRNLMLVPSVEKIEWREVQRKAGSADRLATMTVAFTLMDGDSGETHTFHVIGEGQDAGDKATYKALTGATKYALLKLFLIPTGDDPEEERDAPQRQPRQAAPRSGPPSIPMPAGGTGAVSPAAQAAAKAEAQSKVDKALGREVLAEFGAHKGKPLSTLTPDDLQLMLAEGTDKVAQDPKAKWVPKMTAHLEAIGHEIDRRIAKSA